MKRSLFSKIITWIWRGAALILAFYMLLAAVLDIPFFSTSIGFEMQVVAPEEAPHHAVAFDYLEERRAVGHETYHNVMALNHTLRADNFIGSYFGYQIDIDSWLETSVVSVAAERIHIDCSKVDYGPKRMYLHCDNVTITSEKHETLDIHVVGLSPPRRVDENGNEVVGVTHYTRSFSTTFLPTIDTGASPLGMIVLSLIPIFMSFLCSLLPLFSKTSPDSHKKIVRFGLCAKLLVVIFVFAVMEAPVFLFYASPTAVPFRAYLIIRWLTPVLSIPALSIWIASFKNKKLAPAVAAGIMVLCLYQPLANLICLFATVIAWGYFVEGIRRFFARFKKRKAA